MAADLRDMLADPVRWHEPYPAAPGRGAWAAAENAAAAALRAESITAAVNGRPEWLARVENVERDRPDLFEAFGQAVITAAARPVSAGVCRFCLAVSHARVDRLPMPKFDAADQQLLGRPCASCMNAARAALTASVAATATATPRTPPAVTAQKAANWKMVRLLPGAGLPHSASCERCEIGRVAIQTLTPLIASNEQLDDRVINLYRRALADHAPVKRRLAATGQRKASAVHNGRGRLDDCSCKECRGARIARYESNTGRRS